MLRDHLIPTVVVPPRGMYMAGGGVAAAGRNASGSTLERGTASHRRRWQLRLRWQERRWIQGSTAPAEVAVAGGEMAARSENGGSGGGRRDSGVGRHSIYETLANTCPSLSSAILPTCVPGGL